MAEEINPNSKAYKEQKSKEKNVEKVVQGEVTRKKKSFLRRAEDAMVSEDANTVKEYLFWDVLIPALRDMIVDAGEKALKAIFYGDRRTASNLERDRGITYVKYDKASYDRPYRSRSRERDRRPVYNRRAAHSFDDILLDSKEDAENVLDALVDYTLQNGLVPVGTYYSLVGIRTDYTDWDYGWYELSKARVERVRDVDGWKWNVVLPRPVLIDEEDKLSYY